MGSPPCTMKLLIITLLAAAVSAAPDLSQMTCEECTAEMHKLGGVVKRASPYIENYLINNYCPTLPEDDHACDYDLSMHYTEMLYAVTEHYFVDGATHICQAWGMCRGPGVGRGPHDRPALGSRVRGLPPAKLVHGPALSPDGGAPLPPHARHGHAALLAPAGGL